MALKKSDLYSSLWSSADELRGSMDASQYKDYVLTLLFVKYVSDKAKADPFALIEVPDEGSFDYLISLKGKADVGEKVNVAIRKLAEANNLQGVINNADFDDTNKLGSGKELPDRVSNLIGIFQDIDFTGSRAEGDDLLGDAYEYLMRHFATQSGKSKGQFYTPAEVSRAMAQLLQIPTQTPKSTTVYDPTCGSGSLLIKVADAAPNGLTIYGQENDNATWALARMNMILHGNETHDIRQGNTLANPKFLKGDKLETFDYLVANPPFSVKTWKNGFENDFGRFDGFPMPPDKNGDFAFLLHMVKSLKSTGTGAVILPHGVLFRGNVEAQIRKELIKRGYIKAIIGLPPNLFYGTGIPACILVLDKKEAATRTGIFMIDASRGFEKDGPKNRLRSRDTHKIVDAYIHQAEVNRFSRFVPNNEIEDPKNHYNLNIPRYIDSSEPEDVQDLRAHIHGGIPNHNLDNLRLFWNTFPGLREELFRPFRDGYSELTINIREIELAVLGNPMIREAISCTQQVVKAWWEGHREVLEGIDHTPRPNELGIKLGDSLLNHFEMHPLLDQYAVYEQFMGYWNASMHDDVTLIAGEGWAGAAKPRTARVWHDKNGKATYEEAHFVFGTGAKASRWVMDLIEPDYVIDRFFYAERVKLDDLILECEAASQLVREFTEEHAREEGLLWEAVDDDNKVSATTVKNRLRTAKAEGGDPDEIKVLNHCAHLLTVEAAAKKTIKEATAKLNVQVLAQYNRLSIDDIKKLVIDDKWGATIEASIEGELVAAVQRFTTRLRVLSERYETTMGQLVSDIEILGNRVSEQLASIRELFSDLSGWRNQRLADIADVIDPHPSHRAPAEVALGVPFVGIGDLDTRGNIIGTPRVVAPTVLHEHATRYRFADGLLGLGRVASIGKVVRFPLYAKFAISPTMGVIRPRTVPADFLYYALQAPMVTDQFNALTSGSTRSSIGMEALRQLNVPTPEDNQMAAIGSVLRVVDSEIEALQRKLSKVQSIKQGIMQELLTGKTRPTEEITS